MLALYVNKVKDDNFTRNINYYKEFPCRSFYNYNSLNNPKSDAICTTVIQAENSTQIIFNNGIFYLSIFKNSNGLLSVILKGMSLTFKIMSISVNQYQSISWLTCTIALMNNQTINYRNLLHGLLGNNNGDQHDDVTSRFGDRPDDINNERHVFETTTTCEY
jgi:hypothetical protein